MSHKNLEMLIDLAKIEHAATSSSFTHLDEKANRLTTLSAALAGGVFVAMTQGNSLSWWTAASLLGFTTSLMISVHAQSPVDLDQGTDLTQLSKDFQTSTEPVVLVTVADNIRQMSDSYSTACMVKSDRIRRAMFMLYASFLPLVIHVVVALAWGSSSGSN